MFIAKLHSSELSGAAWHTLWAKIETSKLIETLKFGFKISERGLCVPWKFICRKAERGNMIIKKILSIETFQLAIW